jgi:hypothetical protein
MSDDRHPTDEPGPPPIPAHLREPGPPPIPSSLLPPRTPTWSPLARVTLALVAVVSVASVVALGARNSARLADTPRYGEVAAGVTVPEPLGRVEAAVAQAAAGCEVLVDGEPLPDRTHVDPADAPPPEVLYPQHRPAHSGRHFPQWLDLQGDSLPPDPIDERAVVHNMEHGSVVVWFDAEQVDADTVRAIERWRGARADLGFTSESAGGVFASPAAQIDSGKAVALRAWGVAMDCDRFDPSVADAFLIDHWGSHGASPEANLSPYPQESLRYADDT